MRRTGLSLARDRRGVVAVEFALIAPLLFLLMFGMAEVASLVRVSFKLSHAAESMAKIVSQQPSVTKAGLTDYCKGAGYELAPYASGQLSAALVSLTSKSGGAPTADWEVDSACPILSGPYANAAVAMATTSGSGGYGLTPSSGNSVVVVRASLAYKPILHYILGSTWNLSQTAFAQPRTATTITCSDCSS